MRNLLRSATLLFAFLSTLAAAEDGKLTASQLMAAVKAARPHGGIYARLRMEHRAADGGQFVLQAQIKHRPTADGGTETLYQLLFPKERKGEALLLRKKGNAFSGTSFVPGQGTRELKPGDGSAGLFGTALTIDDAMADFLDWRHEIIGKEDVGAVPCTVVESRAPKSSSSDITRVKSWMDETRLAAMKIELYKTAAAPVRTVLTHKVLRGGSGYYTPASFTVTDHASGASTKVEGVRSERDINYTDADFSEAALKTVTGAPGK